MYNYFINQQISNEKWKNNAKLLHLSVLIQTLFTIFSSSLKVKKQTKNSQ